MYKVSLFGDFGIERIIGQEFEKEYSVFTAENIDAFLEKLETEVPDLVILNLDLPDSRSIRCISAMEHFSGKGSLLFLSDEALFDPSHPLTALPAVDYLLKPWSEPELLLTLEEVLRQCQIRNKAEESRDTSLRLSVVRAQIEDYVRAHYQEDLSMQGVAQVMNYSETHFCRLFKQCFKVNFSVYLNELRIAQAKIMLTSTHATAKEIAAACGYQDNSYFFRVFKRCTGMTPADYRLRIRMMSQKSPTNPKNV